MRNCPHCDKEIQDEAVYCRFCRQDIEPPLWLTSLQKCKYCGEWIERGIELCPLCNKDLTQSQPFKISPKDDSETDDLLAKLRRRATGEEETVKELPPKPKPATVAPATHTPKPEQPAVNRPTLSKPSDEGLAVLHTRRLDQFEERDPLADLRPSLESKPQRKFRLPRFPTRIFRWLGVIILLGAIGAAGYYIVQGPGRELIANVLATSPVSSPVVVPSSTASTEPTPLPGTPEATPSTAATLATATSEGNCIGWEEVGLANEGQDLCVMGELRRWFSIEGMPFVGIFSEEAGTFYFVDRTQTYPEMEPGICVFGEGEIEIMRGVRPFIDVAGQLHSCEGS